MYFWSISEELLQEFLYEDSEEFIKHSWANFRRNSSLNDAWKLEKNIKLGTPKRIPDEVVEDFPWNYVLLESPNEHQKVLVKKLLQNMAQHLGIYPRGYFQDILAIPVKIFDLKKILGELQE